MLQLLENCKNETPTIFTL